jgi:hypothetical protein
MVYHEVMLKEVVLHTDFLGGRTRDVDREKSSRQIQEHL